jgi:hypothetical protein
LAYITEVLFIAGLPDFDWCVRYEYHEGGSNRRLAGTAHWGAPRCPQITCWSPQGMSLAAMQGSAKGSNVRYYPTWKYSPLIKAVKMLKLPDVCS